MIFPIPLYIETSNFPVIPNFQIRNPTYLLILFTLMIPLHSISSSQISKHNLSHIYPLLVANLRNGFPLGAMPALTTTVILPNHISVTQHAELVHQYLSDELEAGRMSGPFSRQRVEKILRGPFFSSPFLISVEYWASGPLLQPLHSHIM